MRKPEFRSLSRRMLDAGIAPKHVRRTVAELGDHYEDLVEADLGRGMRQADAHERAMAQIGQVDDLVQAMASRPELQGWASRYPRAAVVVYPLACLAALPAMPVVAGVAHASQLARWGASLVVAGLVTAGLLLILQLSILFG